MDAIATWQRPNLIALIGEVRPNAGNVREASGESFEGIYRDHYRDVYRYVLLRLRRPDEVDDVVASTFDRAFAAWRSGHGPAGGAVPWLIIIARRILVDRWRRTRVLRWLPLSSPGRPEPPDPADDRQRAEFWMWLDRLAEVLPERQREVVFLRYQRDLSDQDIGEILGLSASGVRTLASRALAALRQHPEIWS